jgi:DNA helicase-2/ATP-dependent DNA helicase PcrA
MWQNDKSADAAGRLENLKELVRSMEEFENLQGFLEHISLVMDTDKSESGEAVSIMTLHSAKGLEFDTVFLPGWEEGLFPSQRTLDEKGTTGLEEERRLAYVGLTRARKRVFISFAANRRVHGQWQSALPSRFIGDLPEAHVDMVADEGFYGNYGSFRDQGGFSSPYSSPGWRRAQEARASGRGTERAPIIDVPAKLVATADPSAARYATGERVFHQKFGYGRIVSVEGNKLLINFDKAGSKRVMDNFVEKV